MAAAKEAIGDSALVRQTVLVVDDSPENIAILSSLLRGRHRVKVATDGERALAVAAAPGDRPDLVLLDITMPGMDGFEVCRRLKADTDTAEIPVVFLSALNETEDKVRAFDIGGVDYVTKPFQAEEVMARVETHLHIGRLRAELERQNDSLIETNRRLNEVNALKDEFMRIASHDLKNPLTCILGFTGVLDTFTPPGAVMTTEAHGWLAKIKGQCRTMQKIIEDFLEFQAMEDGQLKLTRETLDVNELARDTLERAAGYAVKKGIEPHLDLDPALAPIRADKGRLSQVLDNLAGNAIKFGESGSHVTIRTRSTVGGVRVEVSDSGPGLTANDLSKLFVKYAKLGNLPTGGEKSSGLGLAICKKVVELHGGVIGARDNGPDGPGATFWFELPR